MERRWLQSEVERLRSSSSSGGGGGGGGGGSAQARIALHMHVWALCIRLGERSRVSGVQDGAGASTRRVEPEAEDMRALVRKLEKELRALDDKVGATGKAAARPLGREMRGE